MSTPEAEILLAQLARVLKKEREGASRLPASDTEMPSRAFQASDPEAGPGQEAGRPLQGIAGPSGSLMELTKFATTGIAAVFVTLLIVSASTPRPAAHGSRIMVIDANIAMAKFIERPEIEALEEQAFAEAVKSYHSALEAEMQALTASGQVLLLSTNVVLAGDAPDVTDRLVSAALDRLGQGTRP